MSLTLLLHEILIRMKYQNGIVKFTCYALSLVIALGSCKKTSKHDVEPSLEEQQSQLLEEHAKHNNQLVAGVGNVFIQKTLSAGSGSQLVAKQVYNGDTLGFFGGIDGSGAMADLHTVILGKRSSARKLVAETQEGQSSSRVYQVENGQKGKFVLSGYAYGGGDMEVRLVDHNSETGQSTVVMSAYFSNGQRIGDYKVATKTMGATVQAVGRTNEGDCSKPVATVEINEALDNHIPYYQCLLGLLDDDLFNEVLSNLDYPDAKDAVSAYQAGVKELNRMLTRVSGSFGQFKTDAIASDDPYRSLQGLYGVGIPTATDQVDVKYLAAESNLVWDDADTASTIRLTLQAFDKATNKPYMGAPVYIDVQLVFVDSTSIVLAETRATNPETGQVTFVYNPKQHGITLTADDNLAISYQLSASGGTALQQQAVSVVDNLPGKMQIVSGNNQESDWETTLSEPLKVKVTTKGGRALANVQVVWEVVDGEGQLSIGQGVTDAQGFAETQWTTGRNGYPAGKVRVSVVGSEAIAAVFTYEQKRYNFSLGILELLDDGINAKDPGKMRLGSEWKDGDHITLYNDLHYFFRVLLDGKEVKGPGNTNPDGSLTLFGLNSSNIGIVEGGVFHPFQYEDIQIPKHVIHFPNPFTGHTDSITVKLTISNELYRRTVGKTLRIEGNPAPAPPGWQGNPNAGQVLTYTFNSNGTVTHTNLLEPQLSGTFDYSITLQMTEVPNYTHQDAEGYLAHTMKKVIGGISLGSFNRVGGSLIMYEDYSISIGNLNAGTHLEAFNIYWKNMTLK